MNMDETTRTALNTNSASVTSASVTSGNGTRIVQLDILRGTAILLVIMAHTYLWPVGNSLFGRPTLYLIRCGWTGVDLFFVLSGFLIGSLLFNEIKAKSSIDVKRFLIRRGFKIWPSYIIYLIFVTAILVWQSPTHRGMDAIQKIWPNLLHIQNYIMLEERLRHTWSLAVEEHFYLVLPLILWFSCRSRRTLSTRVIPYTALTLALLCTFGRIYNYKFQSLTHVGPTTWTQLRIDALFFGVLLAYYQCFQPRILERYAGTAEKRLALFILGLVCIAPACKLSSGHVYMATVGITLLYIGYGAILLAMYHTPVGLGVIGRLYTTFPVKAIAWIGIYSYPIYLWHLEFGQLPVAWLARHRYLGYLSESVRWWCLTLLFALLSIGAGALFSRIIERPTLALRDRLFPSINNKPMEQPATPSASVRTRTQLGVEAQEHV